MNSLTTRIAFLFFPLIILTSCNDAKKEAAVIIKDTLWMRAEVLELDTVSYVALVPYDTSHFWTSYGEPLPTDSISISLILPSIKNISPERKNAFLSLIRKKMLATEDSYIKERIDSIVAADSFNFDAFVKKLTEHDYQSYYSLNEYSTEFSQLAGAHNYLFLEIRIRYSCKYRTMATGEDNMKHDILMDEDNFEDHFLAYDIQHDCEMKLKDLFIPTSSYEDTLLWLAKAQHKIPDSVSISLDQSFLFTDLGDYPNYTPYILGYNVRSKARRFETRIPLDTVSSILRFHIVR